MTSLTPPPPDAVEAPAAKRARPDGTTTITKPATGASDLAQFLNAVVLIEVTSTSPDFIKPWKMHSQRAHKGSGFAITADAKPRILTNFHVVQDAIDVRLRKHGMSRRWRGKVVAIGPDVDLALVEVHEEEDGKGDSFWQGVTPATWNPTLPHLQSSVNVVGFPTGGTTISVTQGVVSRIDCKNYRVGPAHAFNPGGLLVLQIDAAINPGNSGGPAFDKDGSVVGVAFQSLGGNTDGIGYLIPSVVCQNFLAATAGGVRYSGVPNVPFIARDLRNASLKRRHKGLLVTKVAETSLAPLQVDDVIVAIDGKGVGDDGSVELRASELVSFQWLITCKPSGEPTTFSVLRAGERLEFSAKLCPLPRVLPSTHGLDCQAEYVIIGGLVFTRLSCPLLEDKRSKHHTSAMYDLINFQMARSFAAPAATRTATKGSDARHGKGEASGGEGDGKEGEGVGEGAGAGAGAGAEETEGVLVLTEILAAPLNYGYAMATWKVLDTVNGERVRTLTHLHMAYTQHAGEFFEFHFSHGGDGIILDAAQCRESEAAILKMHAIPSIASEGVVAKVAAVARPVPVVPGQPVAGVSAA